MKLYSIEGNSQKLDGGAMFGNAPKVLWERWFSADSFNRITLTTRALLVQTNTNQNILFETGVGAFFEPKLKERYGVFQNEHILLMNLEKIGLRDSDIDAVILSHLHFDHAGGLLPPYGMNQNTLLFPKAQFFVGKEHWKRACSPHPREKASFIPFLPELLQKTGRLHLVDKGESLNIDLPLHFHFSDGHTIGLMLAEIKLAESPLVFVSDLAPGAAWIHLPITMGYDRFPEKIIDEKQKLFNYLIKNKGRIFFTHDPINTCVKITQELKGKYTCIPCKL